MRVAITGFGAVYSSPTGVSRAARAVLSPHTDLRAHFRDENLDSNSDFDPRAQSQGFLDELRARDEFSLVWGSSKGNLDAILRGDLRGAPDSLACVLARKLGAAGRVFSPNSACATGTHALALGAQLVADGHAQFVVAGATEKPQHRAVLAAYKNMGALSKSGQIRPFDARRDGFLPAWGEGFLVLENETHARNRGAKIHAFLSGAALNCDATHLTSMAPNGDSIARAIENALRKAGAPEIGYINAHGTATRQNDAIESRGIAAALGRKIPVSSTKSHTGHLLGAAGVVEAIFCVLALQNGWAPPNFNLENPDPNCDLNFVRGEGQNLDLRACLSLNYGFGGHIGALIFQRAT